MFNLCIIIKSQKIHANVVYQCCNNVCTISYEMEWCVGLTLPVQILTYIIHLIFDNLITRLQLIYCMSILHVHIHTTAYQ